MLDNGLMFPFCAVARPRLASVGACASSGTGAVVARETRDSLRLEGPLTQGQQSTVAFGITALTSLLRPGACLFVQLAPLDSDRLTGHSPHAWRSIS